MEILTTIIYLFHIKTWSFLYKNPRVFYPIFFIAINIAKQFPRMIQKQLSTPPPSLSSEQASFWLHNINKNNSLIPFLAQTNCRTRNQTTKNQTTSIKLTRNCFKEHIPHSYYPTPIKTSFQHLSIRPLEQTVKFVCSSLNVTNPKNPKAFILHPQANKLFQTYQNPLIFRLQVLSILFKISDNPCTFAWVNFISNLPHNAISFHRVGKHDGK